MDLLAVEPIELIVIAVGFIGTWVALRKDSAWHSEWIKKHSLECDEQRKTNNEILSELRTVTATLTTLGATHDHRLDRIENQLDQQHLKANA